MQYSCREIIHHPLKVYFVRSHKRSNLNHTEHNLDKKQIGTGFWSWEIRRTKQYTVLTFSFSKYPTNFLL